MEKPREFIYKVTGEFTITARSPEEAEARAHSVQASLEWTLNNVEIALEDHQPVE